jgi:hypothetical protein
MQSSGIGPHPNVRFQAVDEKPRLIRLDFEICFGEPVARCSGRALANPNREQRHRLKIAWKRRFQCNSIRRLD